jgi:hypothetical protein
MVIDFTAFKIDRMATEFNRGGEDLMATMLYEILDLYQADAIDVVWEEGMPIPMAGVIELVRDHEPQV